MKETPNFKLKKHEPGEKFDYRYSNYNADIIDKELGKLGDKLPEAIGNKNHVDVMYRNEDKNEPNTIYFIIDEDASDNINAVSYNNVIFAENTPETTAAENWFETEGGEAGAADATKIVMQNGILKVLKTPDENTDFLNE